VLRDFEYPGGLIEPVKIRAVVVTTRPPEIIARARAWVDSGGKTGSMAITVP
jgi:hypothetical protein